MPKQRDMTRKAKQGVSRRRWMLDFGSAMFVAPGIARAAASNTAEAALQSPSFDPRSIWITDLTVSRPAQAHSRAAERGRWRLVDYQARTETGKPVTGTMLMCGPETAPPAVSIPLQARGWHAIYVGLKAYLGIGEPNTIKLKLSSDPCYVLASVETVTGGVIGEDKGLAADAAVEHARLRRRQIQDCFYKYADLTGHELQVSALSTGVAQPSAIAYVRLVPLDEREVSELEKRRGSKTNRRLACMNDNLTFMHFRRPTTREELWEDIYPYKDTDYRAIYWTAVRGDNCLYPTRVGTVLGAGRTDFPRVGDRYLVESLRTLIARKIDPVATALEFTRKLGMEFHLCMRVEAFTAEPPWDGVFRSKFFFDHPELWCMDHDRRTIARLSYAFPETQRHLLALIRELAEYRPDGIMLMFPRAQPYVLYERPVAEAFKKLHGKDVFSTDERDPRLLRVRADILTGFMRKARAEIQAVAGSRPIEFSATVLADEATNRFHALDPAGWVKEGIIDRLSPSPFSTIRSQAPIDIDFFARITRGTRCRLSPTLRPSWLKFSEVIPTARRFYQAGAEELIIFDVNLHHQNPTEWRLWQLLGRKEELGQLEKQVDFALGAIEITQLDAMVIDKYPPLWAF